jgi:hypothetical protein
VTYGLSRFASIADSRRPTVRTRDWTALDRERRLALVECALRPANDRIDGLPLAL